MYIIASPRGANSKAKALSDAYLKKLKSKNPNIVIETIELWDENLPDFDADKAAAKMTFFGEGQMNDKKKSVWKSVVEITERFMNADHYVFAVPMWNGGLPYRLKQYIDIITQPGISFNFDPEKGYLGLLKNKKATVFYTSGVFSQGVDPKYGIDFQSTYFNWWLQMIGIKNIEEVRFQPTILTKNPKKDFEEALTKARELV